MTPNSPRSSSRGKISFALATSSGPDLMRGSRGYYARIYRRRCVTMAPNPPRLEIALCKSTTGVVRRPISPAAALLAFVPRISRIIHDFFRLPRFTKHRNRICQASSTFTQSTYLGNAHARARETRSSINKPYDATFFFWRDKSADLRRAVIRSSRMKPLQIELSIVRLFHLATTT